MVSRKMPNTYLKCDKKNISKYKLGERRFLDWASFHTALSASVPLTGEETCRRLCQASERCGFGHLLQGTGCGQNSGTG